MADQVFNQCGFRKVLESFYAIAEKQGWQGNHTPKNLAAAISVEAAELLAEFQWAAADGVEEARLNRESIAAEMADIVMYLLVLADKAGIDLDVAIEKKTQHNAVRFL